MIQIKDKTFTLYLDRLTIEKRVKELAEKITEDFENKNPVIIGVLNGAFMFLSDLSKHLTLAAEISFIKLSSYQGDQSTGIIKQLIGINDNLADRHVLVVEDIVDTGLSMVHLLESLKKTKPRSIQVAALLHKPEALQHNIKVDYIGFEIPNDFVVGYGLDYDGYGRNLPEIYQLNNNLPDKKS